MVSSRMVWWKLKILSLLTLVLVFLLGFVVIGHLQTRMQLTLR